MYRHLKEAGTDWVALKHKVAMVQSSPLYTVNKLGGKMMRTLTDPTLLLPGDIHAQVSHFRSDAGQFAKVVNSVGNVAAVGVLEKSARLFQVFHFGLETHTNGFLRYYQRKKFIVF